MAREFKPVRFFVMMAIVVFIASAVTAFYTQRAAHGHTSDERSAYAMGETAGAEAAPDAKLPSDADLSMMAQRLFHQRGSGEEMTWKSAFAHGYEDGFKKTHHAR